MPICRICLTLIILNKGGGGHEKCFALFYLELPKIYLKGDWPDGHLPKSDRPYIRILYYL